MAIDLEAERDLSLIFERDDVQEAFAGHCAKSHDDVEAVRQCQYCMQLMLTLAGAISEWLALVDQDRAARPASVPVALPDQGWQDEVLRRLENHARSEDGGMEDPSRSIGSQVFCKGKAAGFRHAANIIRDCLPLPPTRGGAE